MSVNAEKLQSVLHQITEWVPITNEEIKNGIHALIEDITNGTDTPSDSSESTSNPTTVSGSAFVPQSITVQEIAQGVKDILDPTLSSIHDSMVAIEYNLSQSVPPSPNPSPTAETAPASTPSAGAEETVTADTPSVPPTGVPS